MIADLMDKGWKIISFPFMLILDYIIEKGEKAEYLNNRELVRHYLLKGYTTEEIASMTPMTLYEVASHVRYWKGA